jgi:hypothetical protein
MGKLVFALATLTWLGGVVWAVPQSAGPAENSVLINQYCVTCHNERAKTAGLTLDTMDLAKIGEHAEAWENTGHKVEAKGLLYREPNESRLNLTSLEMVSSSCAK